MLAFIDFGPDVLEFCGFDFHYRLGDFDQDLVLGLLWRLHTARHEMKGCNDYIGPNLWPVTQMLV